MIEKLEFDTILEDVIVGVGEWRGKKYLVLKFTTDGRETYEYGLTPELVHKLRRALHVLEKFPMIVEK
jgi:hypothetical protein